MAFGLRNSGQSFQRVVNEIIANIDNCDAYIDDIVVYSKTFDEHVSQLTKLFKKLSDVKFTVNLHTSNFCKVTISYL